VISQYWFRREQPRNRSLLLDLVLPALGFLFCAVIWLGLNRPAKIAGSIWLVVGIFVLAAHTRQFRQPMVMNDPSAYE
jgi:hypothetical protein